MIVLHEKSPGDMSPSELRNIRDAAEKKAAKEKKQKAKRKQSKAYRKYQERVQAYKEGRQKWLEQQTTENKKRREDAAAAANSTGGGEIISSKDTDATATAKGISKVAGVAGRLLKFAVGAAGNRMREKEAARKTGQRKAGERAAETTAAMNQKFLPPGRSGPEKTDKTSRQQPGTSRPGPVSPQPLVTTGQSARLRRQGKRPRLPSSANRPQGGPIVKRTEPDSSSYTSMSTGQRARLDPNFKKKLIQNRMEEYEYSCWREEFLYELGDLRQKTKSKNTDKEPIIDIMKGKNKITIGPNVSESTETPQDQFDRRVAAAKLLKGQAKIKMLKYAASKHPKVNEELNTAAYMAKATPAITGRAKVMSDIHLSKQPGKGTAEMVRDRIRKLFLGDLKNYNPNYDFNGNTADDNDVISNKAIKSESYDEDDETFRQHSRERFSSDSGNETRTKRTSAVLKALAAMNKDVEPKAKKKKKKKSEQ